MLDGNWLTGLAFARHSAGDSDSFFQAIHLIEAVFGRFTDGKRSRAEEDKCILCTLRLRYPFTDGE
jgi:hypothetical protein